MDSRSSRILASFTGLSFPFPNSKRRPDRANGDTTPKAAHPTPKLSVVSKAEIPRALTFLAAKRIERGASLIRYGAFLHQEMPG
jgi:hypothetical protein